MWSPEVHFLVQIIIQDRFGWACIGSFFCAKFHLQTVLLQNERESDGQEFKTSRLDESRCSQIEGARKKENTGVKYRSDIKADRRRNPAESVYYGIVAGFAGLRVFTKRCIG
jgi:hypothetical protein